VGIFKSYDIRGVWGGDWDAGTARAIGRSLPGLLDAREVCVGRDARLSSDEAFEAFAGGVREAGCGVADIGRCDTPAVYFATARYGFDAGVMITASHNPSEYNGLKISRRDAVPVGYGSGLEQLEAAVAAGASTSAPAQSAGGLSPSMARASATLRVAAAQGPPSAPPWATGGLRTLDIRSDYLAHLARFHEGIGSLKIVVDYSNGTGSLYFPATLAPLPCTVVPMFADPDGRFPNHAPNPLVEANLAALKARVLEERADLGLCFDGDADRVMVVDERGRYVSADLLTGLLARYYFTLHPDRLAGGTRIVGYDIRTSRGAVEELERLGADPRMCRVGHSFAKRLLRETQGIMGGELAGHYYFRENYFCDSAFIAALVLLAVLSAERRPLSEAVAAIGRYAYSGEINFEVREGARIVEAVRREYPEGKLTDLDGIRIDFPSWWFNLRTSNTEPLLRLVVEARTPAELAVRVREVTGRIEEYAQPGDGPLVRH
jgi:phosphomannomutase